MNENNKLVIVYILLIAFALVCVIADVVLTMKYGGMPVEEVPLWVLRFLS